MNNNRVYDMLVVGGGPGGYTAALYAARAGLDTVVLEKLSAGGQMALTEQIDNYPGFEERDAVLTWLATLDPHKYLVIRSDYYNRPNHPPIPVLIIKL